MGWKDRLSPEAKAKHASETISTDIHPELRIPAQDKYLAQESPPVPLTKLADAPLPAPYDDKPIIKSIGLAKVKGGWCVVYITSQGNNILDNEIVCGPDPKPIALEQMKLAIVRRIFLAQESS